MRETRYTIEKGEHRPNGFQVRPYIGRIRTLYGNFRFGAHTYYLPPEGVEPGVYMGVSKLLGISWGYHMNHSFRLGWRPKFSPSLNLGKDKIEIFGFSHFGTDGKYDEFEKVHEVETLVSCHYVIMFHYDRNKIELIFQTPDKKPDIVKELDYPFPKYKYGYFLHPYHGGQLPAPKRMKIYTRVKHAGGKSINVRF